MPRQDTTDWNNTLPDTLLVVEDKQARRRQAELSRLQEALGLGRGITFQGKIHELIASKFSV
jgi:hypothetical protein